MDHYHIWFNLRDTSRDLKFAHDLAAYMAHLKAQGAIEGWNLARRKLGFGPHELGEFHVDIQTRDLAQLEQAFQTMAPRAGEAEKLHAAVWAAVTDFRSGLWRDFPDPVRQGAR